MALAHLICRLALDGKPLERCLLKAQLSLKRVFVLWDVHRIGVVLSEEQ